MVYIANTGRSSPEIEARLPEDVPILRDPFTTDQLRAVVRTFLVDGQSLTPVARHTERDRQDCLIGD
jgi:hypothetical protein